MSKKFNYYGSFQFAIPLTNNLVAWWKFDNNLSDSTSNAHNGTGVGSPTYVSGVINQAINFDNTNTPRYVNVADSDDFTFATGSSDLPFSISLWAFNLSLSTLGNWLINKRSSVSTPNIEWQLFYNNTAVTPNNTVTFWLFDTNSSNLIAAYSNVAPFALNTWAHIVATYDGSGNSSGLNIYINGVNVTNTRTSAGTYVKMNNTSSPLRIGQAGWATDATLKHRGYLDMVGIWKNRELTPTEISQIYNSGSGLDYPF
jgi:hypothetical protein